jgi:hypothetical protein
MRMGLLNQRKRVDLGDGEWVEVRPLSLEALRTMRQKVAGVEPAPGEEKEEVQGFALTQMALEACIVAWSDEAPVTPDNIKQLPYEMTFIIAGEVGVGEKQRPLPTGSPSSDTSEEPREQRSPMNG